MTTIVAIQVHNNYSCHMVELIKSSTFDAWLRELRDRRARI